MAAALAGHEHVGDPLRVISVRAPHATFRAERTDLTKKLVETGVVEQAVRVNAASDEDIENVFVIFLVGSGDQSSRHDRDVMDRMRG